MIFIQNFSFKKTATAFGIIILIGIISFVVGFSFGKSKPVDVNITGLEGNLNPPTSTNAKTDFNLFWQTWDVLKREFIDSDNLENKALIYGAIEGLVNAADDPYTVFLPPQEAKQFQEDIEGSFGGIGAEIGIRKEQLVVIAPLDDTPASKAGLKAGDRILEINGTSTAGMDIGAAISLIRGKVGTEVKFIILGKDAEKPKEVEITRALITIPTLKWEIKEGNIAYMKLSSFNAQALRLFYQASLETLLRGADGLVLDLRNNPGGFLEVAVDIGGWFLKRGDVVVIERFKNADDKVFRANGNEAWRRFPVVLLVNEGTASAGEILAGSLQDQKGVKLVGQKTFGKGSVQTLQELSDGSTLKVTVAKWVLPGGRILEKNGIDPDYKIELTEKDSENGKDPQLDKAIEILKTML